MKHFKYISLPVCNISELDKNQQLVAASYPFRVSRYYVGLSRSAGDPVWKQFMPDIRELCDFEQTPDPLAEQQLSPVPNLIHRYPDRVVLLVSNQCPVYCRFCMRKRHVGRDDIPAFDSAVLERISDYLVSHPEIRDVILSGGDPLMLDDESLSHILGTLRKIPHVRIIRIGSRIPVTLPQRITPELCKMLKRFHPVYLNTHFNHPLEITPDSARACSLLADAGVVLGNQSVLLRGVNDTAESMKELMTGLLDVRVRPYYIHHMDLIRGTAHFRTSVETGLDIIRSLRGHVSGLAVPHYVIDLPGGKGKVALQPDIVEKKGDMLFLTTYQGERVAFCDLPPTTLQE